MSGTEWQRLKKVSLVNYFTANRFSRNPVTAGYGGKIASRWSQGSCSLGQMRHSVLCQINIIIVSAQKEGRYKQLLLCIEKNKLFRAQCLVNSQKTQPGYHNLMLPTSSSWSPQHAWKFGREKSQHRTQETLVPLFSHRHPMWPWVQHLQAQCIFAHLNHTK